MTCSIMNSQQITDHSNILYITFSDEDNRKGKLNKKITCTKVSSFNNLNNEMEDDVVKFYNDNRIDIEEVDVNGEIHIDGLDSGDADSNNYNNVKKSNSHFSSNNHFN